MDLQILELKINVKIEYRLLKSTVKVGTLLCVWLRHCATSRKVAVSIPDVSLEFFIFITLPTAP